MKSMRTSRNLQMNEHDKNNIVQIQTHQWIDDRFLMICYKNEQYAGVT